MSSQTGTFLVAALILGILANGFGRIFYFHFMDHRSMSYEERAHNPHPREWTFGLYAQGLVWLILSAAYQYAS